MSVKDFIDYEGEYFFISKYQEPNKKTLNYNIMNYNGIFIGEIKWYPAFRKYSFFPALDTVWDNKCLNEVVQYLDKFNKEYKERGKDSE